MMPAIGIRVGDMGMACATAHKIVEFPETVILRSELW
jgi:hypothetical protein